MWYLWLYLFILASLIKVQKTVVVMISQLSMSGQKRHGFGKQGELLVFILGRPLKCLFLKYVSMFMICVESQNTCHLYSATVEFSII